MRQFACLRFGAATLALCAFVATAHADTLRLAHASSSSSLIQQAATRFADSVSAETGGALTVQIFPDGQLGDEGPIADGVGAARSTSALAAWWMRSTRSSMS